MKLLDKCMDELTSRVECVEAIENIRRKRIMLLKARKIYFLLDLNSWDNGQ